MKEVIEEEIKKTNVSLCGQPTREDDITQSEGIPKVGSRDVKKPTRFKDWNTPWIRRDGKGLKTILRNSSGVDPVAAPVRTSHNHFYSEPHSLLAPEPEPIPLERIEEMREAIARAHDLERRQRAADERPPVRSDEGVRREEANHTPVQPESEVCEGSEPPELEEILENHHREEPSAQQIKANQTQPEKNNNNSLYDVQEEEPQTLESDPGIRQEIEELSEQEATNLLDLETLKKSMEKFSSMSGYEPSADELIQVLKNLENLAASNTPMYMALVQLIQANQSKELFDNMNLMNGDARTPILGGGVDEEIIPNLPVDPEIRSNGISPSFCAEEEQEAKKQIFQSQEDSQEDKSECMKSQVDESSPQVGMQALQPQEEGESKNVEKIARKQEKEEGDIMERLAAKKQEVRLRVKAEPRKIKVVAGSQHRASWPCAPNVTNTTAPKVIEVILGETEEDSFRNRRDVAEKAGLKHIDVILGDESFYPQLFEDFDYPWKGSLRPVSDSLNRHGQKDLDSESVPWASSLRHVPESQKRKKSVKTSSSAAPWIGTLRHVKASNNAPKTFSKPQFKRYPDEDAPNPFQGLSGKDARPAYPLTPAASIYTSSEAGGSFDSANEDVDRIRNNLRETRAISNTLLRVLMPKLLKEHESKYEPLSFEESQRIMDEILNQKIGLGENEGINEGDLDKEINEALLGKVEENLVAAVSAKKKEGKTKKKKKKVTSASSSKKLEVAPAQ